MSFWRVTIMGIFIFYNPFIWSFLPWNFTFLLDLGFKKKEQEFATPLWGNIRKGCPQSEGQGVNASEVPLCASYWRKLILSHLYPLFHIKYLSCMLFVKKLAVLAIHWFKHYDRNHCCKYLSNRPVAIGWSTENGFPTNCLECNLSSETRRNGRRDNKPIQPKYVFIFLRAMNGF